LDEKSQAVRGIRAPMCVTRWGYNQAQVYAESSVKFTVSPGGAPGSSGDRSANPQRPKCVLKITKKVRPLSPIFDTVWVSSVFVIAQCALSCDGNEHAKVYTLTNEIPRKRRPESVPRCSATEQDRCVV
jgi:hypothetical protein